MGPRTVVGELPAELAAELTELLGERFSVSESILDLHGRDESSFAPTRPWAVVFPESTADVQVIVEACARHELYVQRCQRCGSTFYYPRSFCPDDLCPDLEWVRCSGKGVIYTFTVTRQNQSAGFRDRLPYIMAYVELAEGVRMLTNIVECEPDDVKIGMPVEVTFEDVTPDVSLPLFRPAG